MTNYVKPAVLPAWGETNTTSADMIQPANVDIQTGWPLATTPPSRMRFNWILNWCANAIRYFMQRGMADYDAAETYQIGARVIGDDGNLYKSLANANTGHLPSTSPVQWRRFGYTRSEAWAANYAADSSGAANTITVTLSPAPDAYVTGMVVAVKVANAVTGATVMNVNALGNKSVVKGDGSALLLNDLVAGQVALFRYDGTNFQFVPTIGRLINIQTFTVSGTYTPTPGMKSVFLKGTGAGAGGGGTGATGASTSAAAGGGGSGSYAESWVPAATIGASQAVTIGNGGDGATAGANNGSNGGTTSFGAIVSMPGGNGGTGTAAGTAPIASPPGGGGAVATGGTVINAKGAPGNPGFSMVGMLLSGSGGGSPMAGGAGGGGFRNGTAAGVAATMPGGGGGGACASFSAAAQAGGAGADGMIVIFEYA